MNYKVILYVVFTLLAAFGLSGVNFEHFMRKNKYWESRILVMCLSFAIGYLLTSFVSDFLNL